MPEKQKKLDLAVRGALWFGPLKGDGKGKKAKKGGQLVDVLVSKGKIVALTPAGSLDMRAEKELDAGGKVLLPSLTDVHVHLREPGQEYKEDIASGLGAAAFGGFSNILCMANTKPVNDTASVTEFMLEQARKSWPNGPRLFPIGALTKGLKGQELAPMAELAKAGCAAFSNDGRPVESTELFRRAMEYAQDLGKIVIDHCEDPFLAPAAGMNEGEVSSRLGLPAQPDVAEAIQVARDVLLAEYLNAPIHLAHVSCEKSVALIRFAKARGVDVTAETCPHYLTLTEEEAAGFSASAKVSPPLRVKADIDALLDALADGTVDMLATDHAPHAAHEKEVEFDQAPCGISGLDTALATTWELVRVGKLPFDAFVRAWTSAPCKRFGLPLNTFAPGDPADFVLYDQDAAWTVNAETMKSKSKNTPLYGRTLRGRVSAHFLAGKMVVGSISPGA
ncbi:MAG: dihydroorotase [Humidesulfovibrio sp.]|uniref:dihydroorotase n=1 Tax=Humidesulfovibrio sp. TaxID=2910988 RepID=UPI00273772B1|nr:dihydroorotase [Humidesulfovibrio sp.]MDP2849017.1 dihydroorotase [Humidesulfovibrio sp.]